MGQDRESSDDRAGAVLARLEAGAELVDAGTFTLAHDQAREKLAEYRLAQPQTFVLLLVEAAHLLPGCAEICFAFGPRGVRATLLGAALRAEELSSIFDALFTNLPETDERTRRRALARRQIASALNTLLGQPHAWIELRSCFAGGTCTTLRYSSHEDARGEALTQTTRERGEDTRELFELELRDAGPRSQTRARNRERAKCLQTRCVHASIPVRVDGRLVSRGFSIPDAVDPITLRDDASGRLIAHGGWAEVHYAQPTTLIFVANGVILERFKPGWGSGMAAVVEASDLARDLSGAQLIRDEAFDARVEQVRDALARISTRSPIVYDGMFAVPEVKADLVLTPSRLTTTFWVLFFATVAASCALIALLPDPLAHLWAVFVALPWVPGVVALLVLRARAKNRYRRHVKEGRSTVGVVLGAAPADPTTRTFVKIDVEVRRDGRPTRIELFATFSSLDHEMLQPGSRIYLRENPSEHIGEDERRFVLARPSTW